MKKLLIALGLLTLSARALSPSQEALREVNKSQIKVYTLSAAEAATNIKLVDETKTLQENREEFEEIYFKGAVK